MHKQGWCNRWTVPAAQTAFISPLATRCENGKLTPAARPRSLVFFEYGRLGSTASKVSRIEKHRGDFEDARLRNKQTTFQGGGRSEEDSFSRSRWFCWVSLVVLSALFNGNVPVVHAGSGDDVRA